MMTESARIVNLHCDYQFGHRLHCFVGYTKKEARRSRASIGSQLMRSPSGPDKNAHLIPSIARSYAHFRQRSGTFAKFPHLAGRPRGRFNDIRPVNELIVLVETIWCVPLMLSVAGMDNG